ncbi:MAG: transporter permease, partial [Verrucomicrobiaceae bacterium]|nr:transporter permease [Verrucomicrobiaceae bacterium]
MKKLHASLFLLPLLAVVFGLLLWPLCLVAYASFHRGGTFSVSNYERVFTTAGYGGSLVHSLVLSFLVAAFATLVCLGPAWFLAQHEFRGKRAVRAAFTLPLSLSGIMVGFLAIVMLGRVGFVPQTLERLTGNPWLSGTAYQLTGLVIAYLYFEIPRGVLSLESSLRNFNPRMTEAAASLGAGSWQRFRWVILPLISPALLSTFTLTFSISLGSFGVALILSRRFSVLPLELFHQFTAMSDAPLASAMAVV